ncbi:MAG: aldo/keto reductase [Alphaproteobacteria bacterium]|nr:MAG: aldo/keto reductase [Alphaproteobacteria bacterium]
MTDADSPAFPRTPIAPGLAVDPVITGLWQVADLEKDGRTLDPDLAGAELADYARDGFATFDMADHYGSAEIIAGRARRILLAEGRPAPVICTKWCPAPAEMDEATVRAGVETALRRLDVGRIDLMQFHWWRYEDPRYLDALRWLARMVEEGLIGALGVTNFDAAHLHLVCAEGIPVATNQVSFSLLDRRAAGALSQVCDRHGVRLLAYGTLCGGFLSERWLDRPEPEAVADWSKMKYRRFIDAAGGWPVFQGILRAAAGVARRHGVSIANVATRWVLDHPAVAAVIVGARLGESEHRADNRRILSLTLDQDDRAALDAALAAARPIPGDCGDEYRRPPFLTASGDLSHHLDSLPPVYPASAMPARPARMRTETGSVWEAAAGFSRAVRVGDRILVSGTTATDHHGNPVCPDDVEGQATFILDKIAAAIEAVGGRIEDVVRTRIYLTDIARWEEASRAHARVFANVRPANTLVAIGGLVGPYGIEIEAEAVADQS